MRIRKLFTRPIYWLERKRVYPIRSKIYQAAPQQVHHDSSGVVAVLTTPKTFDDAVWTAYSICFHLKIPFAVNLVVDGKLETNKIDQLAKVLPGASALETSEFVTKIQDYPNIHHFAVNHPMGRKLAIVLCLNQEKDIIYSDADVLALGDMSELAKAITTTRVASYICDVAELNADQKLLNVVQQQGLGYAKTLNAGFFFAPKGSLNLEMAESLLAKENYDMESWFPEQTMMAVLMHAAGALPLSRERYVVSTQRQFYYQPDVNYSKISVRHFVTPVRPLMYSRAMPHLWKQILRRKAS